MVKIDAAWVVITTRIKLIILYVSISDSHYQCENGRIWGSLFDDGCCSRYPEWGLFQITFRKVSLKSVAVQFRAFLAS